MILVIGNRRGWEALARLVPEDEELRFACVEELTPLLIRALRPTLVLSSLVAGRFDAVEVAHKLAAAGFQGRLSVLTPRLPQADAVRAEIEDAAGKGIEVTLTILGAPH